MLRQNTKPTMYAYRLLVLQKFKAEENYDKSGSQCTRSHNHFSGQTQRQKISQCDQVHIIKLHCKGFAQLVITARKCENMFLS